ncbi:MAG: glycosyltransferase family 2 protein [Candidatus Omnitrophica bacterium]|nr:glycosyltransferase family 2 protein [Candidatus Omnitrophota bacterium]
MPQLSVIVPVYNESSTIRQILEKINSIPIDMEIIVVDDGSSDGTSRILHDIHYPNLKLIFHTSNRGKGAAFLTGLDNASGEYVIIQDADLEYDPNDYLKLMEAIKSGGSEMVLGARFTKGYKGIFMHRLGNRLLSSYFNFLFGSKLNDCYACYKLIRRDVAIGLGLRGQTFNIDIEIVGKILRRGYRINEVPITYNPRNFKEGKKIRWNDGLNAIFYMLKYRFWG